MELLTVFFLCLAVFQAAGQGSSSSPLAIFNQTGRLPVGYVDGYTAGTDTVLFTIPYTYQQVLSIIGSYQSISWSGSPPNTVTLTGPDNTVGTTRTYDIAGAHVIETITVYNKPAAGPYEEVHTLAPLTVPAANVSFYGKRNLELFHLVVCFSKLITFHCEGWKDRIAASRAWKWRRLLLEKPWKSKEQRKSCNRNQKSCETYRANTERNSTYRSSEASSRKDLYADFKYLRRL